MSLHIKKRADSPFWWISGTVGEKRIRESTGTAVERLAQEICANRHTALVREAVHGKPAAEAAFAAVVASYAEHGGPHSRATKARVLRVLDFFGPATKAACVDQAEIDRACAALLRPGASPATRLREVISPTRAILFHGARRKMCPAPAFDPGRPSKSRTEWLPPTELDRLLTAASPHLRPLLVFLAGTGARLGEALALDWRDVDLVHLRVKLRDTKNGLDRDVDICPRVLAGLLFDPRERQRGSAERLLAGRVFLTLAGKPYAKHRVQGGGQIKTGWAAAVRRAGITRPITPHGLRHTWASWHHAEHRDLLKLRNDGCWSSVVLVERYAHVVPATMQPAILAWRASGTLLAHEGGAEKKTPTKAAS